MKEICKNDNCERQVRARGLCEKCYRHMMYLARKAKAQMNPAPKASEKPRTPHPRATQLMAQIEQERRERAHRAISVGVPE